MAESTVQVPVSLVKSVRTALGFHVGEQDALYREVDALLSQPTPSAEHGAWERAAQVAERDAVGVTLADLTQFPIVQATGARIAFNIRAAAQKQNGPATADVLRSQGAHPKVTVLGRNETSIPATPTRFEDMAPGTTFTADRAADGATFQWRWDKEGLHMGGLLGWLLLPPDSTALDPSTIRDVTPPAPTPDRLTLESVRATHAEYRTTGDLHELARAMNTLLGT